MVDQQCADMAELLPKVKEIKGQTKVLREGILAGLVEGQVLEKNGYLFQKKAKKSKKSLTQQMLFECLNTWNREHPGKRVDDGFIHFVIEQQRATETVKDGLDVREQHVTESQV